MSVEKHRAAEELASQAEALVVSGEREAAVGLLVRASALEDEAFWRIPEARGKTRGIVGVNAVSFLQMADEHSGAAALARRYLAQSGLPGFAERFFVEAILNTLRRQEALTAGRELSASYEVALRGDDVGPGGLVPLDLVLLKLEQFKGYAIRVGEWATHQPFRRRGPVSDAVSRLVVPVVSPASVGSYRFQIGIESGVVQLTAFGADASAGLDSVGASFFDIISTVVDLGPEALADQVSDPDYRNAFLRLVRSLAPAGEALREVEVRPSRGRRSTILVPETKKTIQKHLEATKAPAERETERVGILRALDLDQGRLILREEGQESPCRIAPGALDDVLGPLVNHRVRVLGSWSRNSFLVSDIDEAPVEA
jgi:hypothetical protein